MTYRSQKLNLKFYRQRPLAKIEDLRPLKLDLRSKASRALDLRS